MLGDRACTAVVAHENAAKLTAAPSGISGNDLAIRVAFASERRSGEDGCDSRGSNDAEPHFSDFEVMNGTSTEKFKGSSELSVSW